MMYLFAVLAGCLVVLSMVMNSQLSRGVGVFQGVFINFAGGLLTALPVYFLYFYFGWETFTETRTSTPWYAFLGAFLAIAIVASCNVVIPKIPVVFSAVLIFLGQIVTGLILDAVMAGSFDPYKAVGALLITAGLFVNAKIDAESDRAEAAVGTKPEAVGIGPG